MNGRIVTIVMIGIIFLWISHFVPLRVVVGTPSEACQASIAAVDSEQIDPNTVHFVQTGFPLRTFQDYNNEVCQDNTVPFGHWFRFVLNGIFWMFIVFVITRNLEGNIFRPPYPLILTVIALAATIFGFINIFSAFG